MKRFERILLATAAVAFLSAGERAAAAPEVRHYGPFHSTSPDSGTCGNFWATDTFDRFFQVHTTPNADGSYDVTEQFRNGTFVTDAGPSPGGCDTNPGGIVAAGVTGKMQGSFLIVITGGTYNPAASCDETSCGTTAGFVATVFGPEARFEVTSFLFHYNAKTNGEWKNASEDRGGNHGDITGIP
jgi:hypothetical protein